MIKRFTSIFFLCLALLAPAAQAQTGVWQEGEQASLRLIASTRAGIAGKLYAGLQLRLQPGWHVYWRSPGDAGIPPQPDWKESANLAGTLLLFPWPEHSSMQGLETYGYGGVVTFPVEIKKTDPGAELNLKTQMTLLVCADICVPVPFDVALNLPANFASPEGGDEATSLISDALKHVPKQDDGSGFHLRQATLSGKGAARAIEVHYMVPQTLSSAELIVEVGDGSTVPLTHTQVKATENIFFANLGENAPADLAGKELTFTLIDKEHVQAVEKKMKLEGVGGASIMPPPAAVPTTPIMKSMPAPEPPDFWLMIAFALIGGLILNLMPCVLPVLALKSISFIQHGGGTPSGVRLSFLFTSFGILSSFLVMACAIISLKQAGMSVGWGVQFQHPAFLIFLISILLLFAANLWGFFEIPLPRFFADRLSWTHGHGNLAKDFFYGAFATLLATPCTAPFLGTAVSFSLAGGAKEILSIFMALGLGLAAPFLLIALFPATATWLPKPGKWMEGLKKFLSLLLLITALWLGMVLFNQFTGKQAEESQWQKFDESKIAAYVSEGKTVFVDVTADWCLTCQANKRFVLDTEEMKQELSQPDIILMKADWTKPDKVIADFLMKNHRYGIPFNTIYGPGMPMGVPLPELLTQDAVREGLKKVGKPNN